MSPLQVLFLRSFRCYKNIAPLELFVNWVICVLLIVLRRVKLYIAINGIEKFCTSNQR